MPYQFTNVNPGSDMSQAIAQINNNFAKLDQEAVSKVFYGPGGKPAFLLGKLVDRGYGVDLRDPDELSRIVMYIDSDGSPVFKISKDGQDAYTAGDDGLIFNSAQNIFKIVDTGTQVVTKAGGSATQNEVIAHGLGYAPLVIAFGNQSATTSLLPVPEIVPDISSGLIAKTTGLYVDSTNIVFSLITPSWVGNTFYTDPLTYTFYYYILQESAN